MSGPDRHQKAKQPKPRGTGTIRRERWDKMFANYVDCEHLCTACRSIWQHKLHPDLHCHLPAFSYCPDELEWPNNYGKPLVRVKKR